MKRKLIPFFLLAFVSGISCKKQGMEGLKSLIDIESVQGGQLCASGGIAVKSGIDKNRNNILDADEIDNTKYICNGENGVADKQIFLPLNFSANALTTTPVIGGELIKFSKLNYPGVDSIILVANPYVGDASNTSVVELFNITDNVPISNSTLTTSSLYDNRTFLQTGNLYDNLPDKEITLGIRFSSSVDGLFAASGSCYLILYRN